MMWNRTIGVLMLFMVLSACSRGPKAPDVSHVEVDFELVPFYRELFALSPDSLEAALPELKERYGSYLEAYSVGVIGGSAPGEPEFADDLRFFLSYEPNQEVLDSVELVFGREEWLRQDLEQAFKYYKYYFPEAPVPDVYLHLSGFNQSIVMDADWLSVSVEKYLGRDCAFYEWLSIPVYLRKRYAPEKVVPDVMMALAMDRFAYNDSIDDLINQMVYEGQLRHFVRQMIPDIPDSTLFDYSSKEVDWVNAYEKDMWSYMVEQKHLFSTDRMALQRYVGKSPFTYYFGQESPGSTGVWLGYRIVQAYLKRHPETTLDELMQMNNGHDFLRAARYRP